MILHVPVQISMLHNIHVKFINFKYNTFHYSESTRKLKLFSGHLFSNAVKIMLFILDAQHYVPIKLCRTAREA